MSSEYYKKHPEKREAKRKQGRIYYWANREKIREKERKRYRERKQDKGWYRKILDYNSKWGRENRDKINRCQKNWRERNIEKSRAYIKKWRENNREKLLISRRISEHKRRTLSKSGSFTAKEWEEVKKQYNYTCPMCGRKEPEIKLTIDHIIPLSKGGMNTIKNIQPLCAHCNCVKYNNYEQRETNNN